MRGNVSKTEMTEVGVISRLSFRFVFILSSEQRTELTTETTVHTYKLQPNERQHGRHAM